MSYAPPPSAPISGPLPGWYARADSADPQWWSGIGWSGHRVKGGDRVRPTGLTVGPSKTGFIFAGVWAVLALARVVLSFASSVGPTWDQNLLTLLFFGLAVMWLVGALQARKREQLPAPASAPLVIDAMRPMPGDVEGPYAAWYDAPSVTVRRWWTGTRWAEYRTDGRQVLPTAYEGRMWKVQLFTGVALVVALLIFAFVLPPLLSWPGWMLSFMFIVLLIPGSLLIVMPLVMRRRLVASANPPPVTPARVPDRGHA